MADGAAGDAASAYVGYEAPPKSKGVDFSAAGPDSQPDAEARPVWQIAIGFLARLITDDAFDQALARRGVGRHLHLDPPGDVFFVELRPVGGVLLFAPSTGAAAENFSPGDGAIRISVGL